MEKYVQLRWLCAGHKGCGEFQEWCYPESEPEARACPKCGREVRIKLARCTGVCTWFEPYCTRPRRKNWDWVKGKESSRRSGKSTGRPRKKPLNNTPYVATMEVKTEVM